MARIGFDEVAGTFHGRIEGIQDIITFEGCSLEEIEKAFHDSVDDYLEWAAGKGFIPDPPPVG